MRVQPPGPWTRHATDVVRILGYYGNRADPPTDYFAQNSAWAEIQRWLPLVHSRRDLLVHACSAEVGPRSGAFTDLRGRDVTGQGRLPMHTTTGFHVSTIAAVLGSPDTAGILRDAIVRIETEHLGSFSFVCSGGTHRSVACGVALILIAYPAASIQVYTNRTKAAAAQSGWTPTSP